MTETFLFVRLGEGEVYRNVVWKLQKCHVVVYSLFITGPSFCRPSRVL